MTGTEVSASDIMGILDGADPGGGTEEVTPAGEGSEDNNGVVAVEGEESGAGESEETGEPGAEAGESGEDEGEKAAEGQPKVEQLKTEDFDPEVGPPRDDGKEWHWKKEKAQRIYAGYQDSKAYKEIAPTIEEATQMRDSHVDLAMMARDFTSGEPERVDRFLGHWNSQSPQAMVTLAERLYDGAKGHNQQVYETLLDRALKDATRFFYDEYAGAADKNSEEAKKSLYAAQSLDWFLRGEFEAPENIKPVDRNAERLADLERREAALRSEKQSQVTQARDTQRQEIHSTIRAKVLEEVDSALKPIAHLKTAEPLVYKAARNEIIEQVKNTIRADNAWSRLFGIQFDAALGDPSESNRTALVNQYLNRSRRVIDSAKVRVLNDVGKSVVSKSNAKHERASNSQQAGEREATGTAAPAGQRVTNPNYEKAKGAKDTFGMVNALLS